MNEKRLLSALRSGDAGALSKIIELYTPYLFAIVSNIFRGVLPEEDAEEIVADSFAALWYTRNAVENGTLKSYLAVIARNKALSRLRSLHLAQALEDDVVVADCSDLEAQTIAAELSALARRAVDALPEEDREIFLRHYFLYQPTADISADMGIKPATVRTRLARGREKLRAYLEERGYSYENIFN